MLGKTGKAEHCGLRIDCKIRQIKARRSQIEQDAHLRISRRSKMIEEVKMSFKKRNAHRLKHSTCSPRTCLVPFILQAIKGSPKFLALEEASPFCPDKGHSSTAETALHSELNHGLDALSLIQQAAYRTAVTRCTPGLTSCPIFKVQIFVVEYKSQIVRYQLTAISGIYPCGYPGLFGLLFFSASSQLLANRLAGLA